MSTIVLEKECKIQKEALLYEKLPGKQVHCRLCPHHCIIHKGEKGICQVRENRNGSLYTLVYGRTFIQNVDTVEKKPLFHFYPGSTTYSISTQGCNFHCQYCINWEVSQTPVAQLQKAGSDASPHEIVAAALNANCRSIAYTYVEPTIFFEYIHEIATLAQAAGMTNIFKTNGFMTADMLELCQPYLDAANVDLKTFRDKTYRQFGGRLRPVLDSLKQMKNAGVWLEITTVIIPGVNDNAVELRDLSKFIVQELGSETPWHIARFFPSYEMENIPPTPIDKLHQAHHIGREQGLNYIYFSNLLEKGKQDTFCIKCGQAIIRRHGFKLLAIKVLESKCFSCGTSIPGYFE